MQAIRFILGIVAALTLTVAPLSATSASLFVRAGGGVTATTYPAGVSALGLEGVYDSAATSGIALATNKTVGVDTLPSGASLAGNTVTISCACTVTVDRWNFAGYDLVVTGNTTNAQISNANFYRLATTGYSIQIGTGSDTPNADFTTSSFNFLTTVADAGLIYFQKGSTGSISYSKFLNASTYQVFASGVTNINHNWFGTAGTNSSLGIHVENVRYFAGLGHVFSYNMIDNSAIGGGGMLGNWTSPWSSGGSEAVSGTFSNNVVPYYSGGSKNTNIATNVDSRDGNATWTMTNNALGVNGTGCCGRTAYVAITEDGDSFVTLTASGNRDLVSGSAINLTYP